MDIRNALRAAFAATLAAALPALAVTPLADFTAVRTPGAPVPLFGPVSVAKSARPPHEQLVGTVPIGFDVDALKAMNAGDLATFSLPNGRTYNVVLDRLDRFANGDISWVGHLDGGTVDQLVVVTIGAEAAYGSLHMPEGNWGIAHSEGVAWLFDSDHSGVYTDRSHATDAMIPPTPEFLPRAKADPAACSAAILAMPAEQTTIDVMFVLTPDWIAAHGAANAGTRLNNIVSSINSYYANSKIAITLRRVATVTVDHPAAAAQDSASCGTAPACDSPSLSAVTNGTGNFSNIALLRNLYGADMVLLMRGPRSGGNSISGVAWIGGFGTNPISSYAGSMYSLNGDATWASGTLVAHEMGHNMGNNHDPSNASASAGTPQYGATTYAYGWTRCGTNPAATCPVTSGFNQAGTGGFGTIMSYWRPTAPRFSNPSDVCNFNGSGNVICGGTLSGNTSGGTITVTSDEVRAINCTRGYTGNTGISQMRTAHVPDCATPTLDTDNDGIPDCVERALGKVTTTKDNDVFSAGQVPAALFTMQQYRDFLAREADADGLNFWITSLLAATNSRASLIEAFFNSPEFQGNISPVTRLYFAYFLRIPDYSGLQFWIGQFKAGTPLATISQNFALSAEFTTRYGALNNSQFVDLVYQNVLGRAADAGGKAFWQGQLDTNAQNRGQVMLGFSESAEYVAASANKVYVTMMYSGMLRRSPDQPGFDFWVNYKNQGNSGQALISGFLAATEYRGRFLP